MTDWRDQAACRGLHGLMFPGRGESVEAQKALCAVCPVREECLAYAIAENEQNGIWGGLSERERRRIRGQRARDNGCSVWAERKKPQRTEPYRKAHFRTLVPADPDDMPPWMLERIERLRLREAALAVPDDEARDVDNDPARSVA